MSGGRVLVEIAVESVDGARAAAAGGADRIELAQGLDSGGTTPSAGLLAAAIEASPLPVVVLVRPRPGDFLYSAAEIDTMRRDVLHAKAAGASGVAIGCLRADGTLDDERLARLVSAARPMSVTLHRAFDMTRDPFAALDAARALGFDRVLTSGQRASAFDGRDLIARLVRRTAGPKPIVMPGAGIRPENAAALVAATGAREIHLSAAVRGKSGMLFRNPDCSMGGGSPAVSAAEPEFDTRATDAAVVRAVVSAVRGT